MKEELYDYNFDVLKKQDDEMIDKSHLASKKSNIDIFSQFDELDNYDISDDLNNNPINGYEDLILEAKSRKTNANDNNLANELENDYMENTLSIDSFHDEILNNIDDLQMEKPVETINDVQNEKEKAIKNMEEAFIYCSILGFIVMIFGYEWFFYIIHHI